MKEVLVCVCGGWPFAMSRELVYHGSRCRFDIGTPGVLWRRRTAHNMEKLFAHRWKGREEAQGLRTPSRPLASRSKSGWRYHPRWAALEKSKSFPHRLRRPHAARRQAWCKGRAAGSFPRRGFRELSIQPGIFKAAGKTEATTDAEKPFRACLASKPAVADKSLADTPHVAFHSRRGQGRTYRLATQATARDASPAGIERARPGVLRKHSSTRPRPAKKSISLARRSTAAAPDGAHAATNWSGHC
mmetsp:Transcript_78048/g.148312  ORF Transcript_78048/g.148312 Transcript_78048/m.148312 type:complete len:245 (-) Transcript_78048:1490-2224(-)